MTRHSPTAPASTTSGPFQRALASCSPDEVRATTHALLLQMARATDPARFPDEMKGALALAMLDAGLTPDSTRAAWDDAIKAFVATRPVRDDLLEALRAQLASAKGAQR